jgi:hypothetical protein
MNESVELDDGKLSVWSRPVFLAQIRKDLFQKLEQRIEFTSLVSLD